MAGIRYIFGDLRTGLVSAEMALQGVTLNNKLNGIGNMGATLVLDQSGQQNIDLVNATIPGKSFVVVERDDVPIWDGIVWTRTYQAQAKIMQLSMKSREGYLEKVLLDTNFTAESEEQRNIMVDLFTLLQADPNRNLGITVPPATYSDAVLRNVSVLASEYKSFFSVISAIADGENGFDWNIETQRVGDSYLRSLRIGYPYLGSTSTTALSFDYPGAITNYYETEGMSGAGTKVILLGSGEGSAMITSTAENTAMYDNGWLRYDATYSRKDITDQTAADSLVLQQAGLRKPPMATLKVFVKADIEPVFGTYNLGDTASIFIKDARHPDGVTFTSRMVAFDYRPPSDSNIESAELIFEGDELNEG
jgi:hypothetical protein